MSEIRLNIDGREVRGYEGQTLLEIARENGVEIPTLCHDERVKMYGSCGVCVVEAEGSPKLLRSCSTYAAQGMIIHTDTDRVRGSRKTALELLLSDHSGDCRPPCVLACPGQTDCQGYVGLIANGEYREALKLVKDKIPLPGAIGRVCPHPCEEACRRELVEEPISIAALKQFVGDLDLAEGAPYTPEIAADTGKKIAVIGGGPGGLTAAYFLRSYGHSVTVYDQMPHMGGMLRYGIPEYRLPKKMLQEEIDAIGGMGVEFRNNIAVGKDLSMDWLRGTYDAVIVAVGAWSSTGLRCPGEELEGVLGGIDFLRDVALGNPVYTGRKIAVVGGGNTAMDACRTAVRLGAEEVYNIYRRTKAEMPAEEIEILEAEEEGVIFKNLRNPNEVVGENGRVRQVRLQVMELGEPDASGRRAPVPVEGKEEVLEVDTVIVAIGQKLDPKGLEDIEQTKWRTVSADANTFRTNLPGVFAIGDATNGGADIAITAIGEAKKAAVMVDKYLGGEELGYEEPYLVKREMTAEDFAHREKEPRAKMPHRPAKERRKDFLEINHGLSEEEARREAGRCLECGCMDYFECKLIDYANQYKVAPEKYDGQVHHREPLEDHPFLHRNPDKCILCGLCVRICDEVVGATALGLVDRGFDTVVKPALDMDLRDTDCISCGQCVAVCPTGALTETLAVQKQVPVREMVTPTTCGFCSVGCQSKLTHKGGSLLRSLPGAERPDEALLCSGGRFGFIQLQHNRLTKPMRRIEGRLQDTTFQRAAVLAGKNLQALKTQYGENAIAVAVSDRYTNEQVRLVQDYAQDTLGCKQVFSFGKVDGGIADMLGRDGSTCTLEELRQTELIVLVETDLRQSHAVAGFAVKRAVENGAKLVVLNSFDSFVDELAHRKINPGADLGLLLGMLKVVVESGGGKDYLSYAALKESVADVQVSEAAKEAAEIYLGAKKAVFVFDKNNLSADAARMIGNLAIAGGHAFGPRNGILQLLPGANSQGLADSGVLGGEAFRKAIADGEIKGLFIFGEDPRDVDLGGLEFLAVQDIHLTETGIKADVVLPGASFAETGGTFTNLEGKTQAVRQAVRTPVELGDLEQFTLLANAVGAAVPYRTLEDVTRAVQSATPPDAGRVRLLPVQNGPLVRRVESTNCLVLEFSAYKHQHRIK